MIDTSIQFNNHNSYKATEDFWHKPFGVELMTHITIAAIFYATSPQAEANRIRVIFLDENGARVQVSNHAIGIGIDAARQSVTVAVPAGAKQAQIGFLAGNYWWAEAKAEEGETATAYAINAAGQLTYLTPNGIYTHTLQAKQIVITDKEALNDRLVTINQNHMALTDVVTGKTTKMTSDGVYTGEVVADQVKTGLLKSTNGASQINLGNGTFNFGNGALQWDGSLLSAKGSFSAEGGGQSASLDGGSFRLLHGSNPMAYFSIQTTNPTNAWMTIPDNARTFTFAKLRGGGLYQLYRIELPSVSSTSPRHLFTGPVEADSIKAGGLIEAYNLKTTAGVTTPSIFDVQERVRISVSSDGSLTAYDNAGNLVIWISKSGNFAQLHLPSSIDNAIGVDATGAYKIKSGTKTYL